MTKQEILNEVSETQETFIKRLSDDKLFSLNYCTFFSNFKQVLVEPYESRHFILNKGEFEIVYLKVKSYVKSYEENVELESKWEKCRLKLQKEFYKQYSPEPEDWDSKEYENWNNSFFDFIEKGLKEEGFNEVNGFWYE